MRHIFLTVMALLTSTGAAFSQAEQHDQHHTPAGETLQPKPPPTLAQPPAATTATPQAGAGAQMNMMGAMPEQCRRAIQGMPKECSGMMQTMMQGMLGGAGATQGAPATAAAPQSGSLPPHGAEMQAAMDRMHAPMMEAARQPNADEAFVRGMIPHHQAAIDMAQSVMKHGKDEQAKKMAADVIREQTREIQEMQDWLKKHGK